MPSLFLYQLALPRMAIGKRIPEGEFPLGSGPYKILRQSDDLLELVVNPFYHSPSALKNNGVTLKYVDENAFLDGLRKDHLDGTIMYRAQAIPQGLPDSYRLLSDKPNITFALVLNPKRYPFDKPIVRKFVMAELYNTTRWEACATHVRKAYGYIPAGLGGSLSAMAPLKMVGPSKSEVMTQVPQLKKGAKISIQQHQGRKSECEAKAISSALEKINIEAKWNYHSDYKTLWPKYLKNDYDAFAELFVFSQREAFSQLRRFYSTSRENFENIRELSLDELIRSIWAPSSTSRRYEVYRSVNEFLLSYASVIPLYYSSHRNLLNKCIQGVKEDEFVFDPFPNLFRLSRSTSCQGAL
jgi:ABC-type oligopeptide transport system substrate-binding subunit